MVKSYKWMFFLAKRIILQVGLPKKDGWLPFGLTCIAMKNDLFTR